MLANLRLTLKHVFSLSLLGLLLSLALLFYLVLNGSERTILQSAERFRDAASREVIKDVTAYLNEAPLAVMYFEKQIGYGLIDPRSRIRCSRGCCRCSWRMTTSRRRA